MFIAKKNKTIRKTTITKIIKRRVRKRPKRIIVKRRRANDNGFLGGLSDLGI